MVLRDRGEETLSNVISSFSLTPLVPKGSTGLSSPALLVYFVVVYVEIEPKA